MTRNLVLYTIFSLDMYYMEIDNNDRLIVILDYLIISWRKEEDIFK